MRSLCRTSLFALLPGVFALPAMAQDRPGFFEEIVVTAQKREQAVLDVPITLSAYSGDFLDSIGVEEFERLSYYVPGLIVQEQSPNNPGFVIRGITSDSGSAQIAPRVSIFQDGIDISRSRGSIIELYDLERVEVLKGPQATLFGTAAAIGAISLISAPPTDSFEASASVGVGNYDERRSRGYISGPLGSDRVRGRLSWLYRQRDGFIENIDGAPESQNPNPDGQAPNLNGKDTLALRAYLSADLTDQLMLDLIWNYQRDQPPGTAFKSGVFTPTGGDLSPFSFAELGPFGSRRNDALGGKLGLDRTVKSYTARLTWDVSEAWQVTSISNYREFDSLEVFDADGTAALWLEFAEDASGDQWSQEVRFNYDAGGDVTGFFGATWFNEDGQQRVPFITDEGVFAACLGFAPGLPCFAPDGSVNSILPAQVLHVDEFANTGETSALSAYADASWQFTPRWRATVGGRYVRERKRSGFTSAGTPSLIAPGNQPLLSLFGLGNTGGVLVESERETFTDFSPRFVLDFLATDEMRLFASVSKGRRSEVINVGGVPGPAPSTVAIVDILPAEKIWSYELGMKTELLERRLQFDAGVFYQDYENFQTSVFDNAGQLVSVNAGTATNRGVEAAMRAIITPNLDVFANVGYIDAKFDDTDKDGNPALFAGNRFRLQPEWSTAAGVRWNQPIASGMEWFGSLAWSYRSSVFFEEDNAPVAGVDIREDSVHLVDLRVGLTGAAGQLGAWTVTGYASNLLNKNYLIDAGNTGAAFGTPTLIAGAPRFYGLELKFDL
ncbi:MAG: TonB-dependent receptor [Gammaproteobacteria bacterium]|nr:MAG: TonB-dependent receptor [Gammaproteobacteria bacterium]